MSHIVMSHIAIRDNDRAQYLSSSVSLYRFVSRIAYFSVCHSHSLCLRLSRNTCLPLFLCLLSDSLLYHSILSNESYSNESHSNESYSNESYSNDCHIVLSHIVMSHIAIRDNDRAQHVFSSVSLFLCSLLRSVIVISYTHIRIYVYIYVSSSVSLYRFVSRIAYFSDCHSHSLCLRLSRNTCLPLFLCFCLSGEVGGWGRDPKKCTGRDWGMGSTTI